MPLNIDWNAIIGALGHNSQRPDMVNLNAGGAADRAMQPDQSKGFAYADQVNPTLLARAYANAPQDYGITKPSNNASGGFSDWMSKYGTPDPTKITPASNDVSQLRDMASNLPSIPQQPQNIFQRFADSVTSPEFSNGIKRFFFGDIMDPNTATIDQLRNARHGFLGDLGDALMVGGGANPMYANTLQNRYETALARDKYNRDMAVKEAESKSNIAGQDAQTTGLNIDNQYKPIFNSQKAVMNQNDIQSGYLKNAEGYMGIESPQPVALGNGTYAIRNPKGGWTISSANGGTSGGKGKMSVDDASAKTAEVYGDNWKANPEANAFFARLATGGNMPANITDKGNVSPAEKIQQEDMAAIDSMARNLNISKAEAAKRYYSSKYSKGAANEADSSVRIINGKPARNPDGSYNYNLMGGVSQPVFRQLADDPKLHISAIKAMPDYTSEDPPSTYRQDLSKYAPKRFDAMTQESKVIHNLWRAKALINEMKKTGDFNLTGGQLLASPLARKYSALQNMLDSDMKKAGRLDATVTNYDSKNLAMQVPKLGLTEGGWGVVNTYDHILAKIDAALATYGEAFNAMDTEWGHGAKAFKVDKIIH